MLQVADVFEALTGNRPKNGRNHLNNAVNDSRLVTKGSLFVAMAGDRVDGHAFVTKAFKNGATLALIEKNIDLDIPVFQISDSLNIDLLEGNEAICIRVDNSLEALQKIARFWRRKLEIKVVGITGSVGKTTSKELIADVLGCNFKTIKSQGNYNNEIGLPLTILSIHKEHEYAVLEMGFYLPGEIAFLADIALPQIAVVTTIGLVHAERAGSQDAIFRGKSELVQSLPKYGTAILNIDDPLVKKMASLTSAKVFFYGLDSAADLWADEIEGLGLDGLRFRLHDGDEIFHIKVPMIGRHSVHTALRAAAVGMVAGMAWPSIIEGLQTDRPQLRLVAHKGKNGVTLLDDTYNASPDSALAALNLLEELEGRKVAVLGDMLELGPYEKQGHQMVGVRAAIVADIIVTVGERAKIIAETARLSGKDINTIMSFENSDEALNYLRDNLRTSDVVLVKGSRAMNMEKIVLSLEMES